MNILLILIQFGGGFYSVAIDHNYIVIAYFPEGLDEDCKITELFDFSDKKVYHFEEDIINTFDEAVENLAVHEMHSNLKKTNSVFAENLYFLGYSSVKYYEDCILSNYFLDNGCIEMKLENVYADVAELDEFITDKRIINLLPWIGNGKQINNKNYINIKSTILPMNDMDEPMNSFEVIQIKTTDKIPDYFEQAIKRIKNRN